MHADTINRADLIPLVGSEKQIAWAADIRERVLAQAETYLSDAAEAAAEGHPYQPDAVQKRRDTIAWLTHRSSAKWWIDVGKLGFRHLHGYYDAVKADPTQLRPSER